MLPASNRATGTVLADPDVCLTPPLLPYPNTAANSGAVKFALTVIICGGNALNVGSIIGQSTGDEPGKLHWTTRGEVTFLQGYPKVLIEGTPGVSLTHRTSSNRTNAVGLQAVPSATNVLYGLRRGGDADDAVAIAEEVDREARAVGHDLGEDGVGFIAIPLFATSTPARVHAALADLERRGATAVVFDLRKNPGGEAMGAIELAGDFLEPGSEIARLVDGEGDAEVYRARARSPSRLPLVLLVDGGTASAAELFAGALRAHGRATLVGARTFGKGTVQRVTAGGREEVARVVLPGGRELHGVGLAPDVAVPR